jgi:hypothetical protein
LGGVGLQRLAVGGAEPRDGLAIGFVKRWRQLPTVPGVTPNCRATVPLSDPAAHASTMRARRAVRWSVFRRRASIASLASSSVVKISSSFGLQVRIHPLTLAGR